MLSYQLLKLPGNDLESELDQQEQAIWLWKGLSQALGFQVRDKKKDQKLEKRERIGSSAEAQPEKKKKKKKATPELLVVPQLKGF